MRNVGAYHVGVVGLSNITTEMSESDPISVLNLPMPNSHIAGYTSIPGVRLAAVCDLKEDLRHRFLQQWNDRLPEVRVYRNHIEMLREESLSIVSVATADHQHAQVVIDVAQAGVRGIICEKPLATTLEECNAMLNACDRAGALLSVYHKYRFRPAFHTAAAAIAASRIGDVHRIVGHLGGERAMLFRNGTHLIDGICFFARSEPEWVIGVLDLDEEDVTTYQGDGGLSTSGDPGALGLIHFANGIRAVVNCSKHQQQSYRIELIGESGRIVIENDRRGRTAGAGAGVRLFAGEGVSQELIAYPQQRTGIAACIAELAAALEGRAKLTSPGVEARKSVRIIIGFLESQRRGHTKIGL